MHAQGSTHRSRSRCIECVHMFTHFTPSSPGVCSKQAQNSSPKSLGPWSGLRTVVPMADRDLAWCALETLFGSQVRVADSQAYQIKIVRVCGLSDRLTGLPESTYVLHHAALLWLPFRSVHRLSTRQSKRPSRASAKDVLQG